MATLDRDQYIENPIDPDYLKPSTENIKESLNGVKLKVDQFGSLTVCGFFFDLLEDYSHVVCTHTGKQRNTTTFNTWGWPGMAQGGDCEGDFVYSNTAHCVYTEAGRVRILRITGCHEFHNTANHRE